MNTYLLPVSDDKGPWIEKVYAKGISEAEDKFVKLLADAYEFIDYGGSFNDMLETLQDHDILVGDIYDIEEF